MNINFKKGINRIAVCLISVIAFLFFIVYISNGCIFDNTKFIKNTYIRSEQSFRQLPILEFAENYLSEEEGLLKKYWGYNNINCSPYKQYCTFKGIDYKLESGKIFKFELLNPNFIETNTGSIIMPSPLKYLFWQIKDFLMIIIWAFVFYGIYLLIQAVFIWIIKGFKE